MRDPFLTDSNAYVAILNEKGGVVGKQAAGTSQSTIYKSATTSLTSRRAYEKHTFIFVGEVLCKEFEQVIIDRIATPNVVEKECWQFELVEHQPWSTAKTNNARVNDELATSFLDYRLLASRGANAKPKTTAVDMFSLERP